MSGLIVYYSCYVDNFIMTSSLSLWIILDNNKLIGPNFVDWMKNLRIILVQEKIFFILDTPSLDSIREDATEEERAKYKMWQNDSTTIKCIMLASMSNELQRQYKEMDPQSILLKS